MGPDLLPRMSPSTSSKPFLKRDLYVVHRHDIYIHLNSQPLVAKPTAYTTSSVANSFSGPNDIGSSCSSVITVDLPSLSYIRIGILS